MKIADKIREITTFISENEEGEGPEIARNLQQKAALAMRHGMESQEWEDYMREFATNSAQLQRLKGQDSMMNEVWGLSALAYIVGNGVCTMVSRANTIREMEADMISGLDRNLSPDPDEDVIPE